MRILSISVGQPREVADAHGRTVRTSIFKASVGDRAVRVNQTNIDGDRQSDLVKHGGRLRAVYMYPSEHYAYWKAELPGTELPWGAFGENLTSEGLLEDDVLVGDLLRVGSAELVVTRPRRPCYKLGIRLGRGDIAARFRSSGRSGFYLSVAREGELRAGDAIARVTRGDGPTIREMLLDADAMQTRITLPRPGTDEFHPAYARYIGRIDAITDAGRQLEAQRDRVVGRLSQVSNAQGGFRYAPGKWSVAEVVGHLADAERIFSYRLLRIGRGDETPLAGFDENTYAPAGAFDRRPLADVVEEFVAVRNATIALVRGMPSEGWARRGTARDSTVTTAALAYIILGHVEHHLAILDERYDIR